MIMKFVKNTTVFFVLFILYETFGDIPCSPRKYNHNSIVCVCNSTYCDEISKIEKQPPGSYVIYFSDKKGNRFNKIEGKLIKTENHSRVKRQNDLILNFLSIFQPHKSTSDELIINVDRSRTFQTIVGFGGSFTDSTGINYNKHSKETKKKFIDSYFSENGLEYNMGRVPIGGTDFSTHAYAYNMFPENDVKLSNFSLTEEDFIYKIPLIKEAENVAKEKLFLLGSTWSPPVWMKSNYDYGGFSKLLSKYYQTYADYHIRFLEEYDKQNISFWAISTGNEPLNGIFPFVRFNSLGWFPGRQAKWVADNLGPTMKKSKFKQVQIIANDGQRSFMLGWMEIMARNKKTMHYIDGIAVHWYVDDFFPVSLINDLHNMFPEKYIIGSEACTGEKPWQFEDVELGSWDRAELYIKTVLQNLNHWYVGWIDWNLILDKQGGPNWYKNFVDANIISLPENDEFVKQPLFYAFGHITKFIPRGSVRVHVDLVPENQLYNVAFLRPDGGIAIVFFNLENCMKTVTVQEEGKGNFIIKVEPRSIYSIVYW